MNQTETLKWYNTVTLRLTKFDLYVVQIKDTQAVAEGKKSHMFTHSPRKVAASGTRSLYTYMFLLPFIHECLMLQYPHIYCIHVTSHSVRSSHDAVLTSTQLSLGLQTSRLDCVRLYLQLSFPQEIPSHKSVISIFWYFGAHNGEES